MATVSTTLDALVRARDLIAEPEHWCQGSTARDKFGLVVNALNPSATKWCSLGALDRVFPALQVQRQDYAAVASAAACLSREMGSIAAYNDTHSHAEVLAAFDRAIEAERAKG